MVRLTDRYFMTEILLLRHKTLTQTHKAFPEVGLITLIPIETNGKNSHNQGTVKVCSCGQVLTLTTFVPSEADTK